MLNVLKFNQSRHIHSVKQVRFYKTETCKAMQPVKLQFTLIIHKVSQGMRINMT
jgi:hypothetical protein